MTIDELKMKVIDLEWAVMEKNSVDRRYFQQEIFDEITNLHVMLQASEQDRDILRDRVKMLEEASVEHLAKAANINARLKNYQNEQYGKFVYQDTDSIFKENPVEMEDHPSPDELDDPLPFWDLDHESIAPAEEVEGFDE